MKTIPLRQLLRQPLKVKRWTRAGQSVQVTDNGRPLWVIRRNVSVPHASKRTVFTTNEETHAEEQEYNRADPPFGKASPWQRPVHPGARNRRHLAQQLASARRHDARKRRSRNPVAAQVSQE